MNKLIAYNCDELNAILIHEKSENWFKKGLISKEKLEEIKSNFLINFYSPNVFMRIGAFLFCCLLIIAFSALFAISSLQGNGVNMLFLFFSLVCFLGLELMINSRHYKSGIDDALLYLGLGFLMSAIVLIFKLNADTLPFYLVFLPLMIAASIRYLDSMTTVISYGFAVAIIVLSLQKLEMRDPSVYSAILMLFAALTYFLAQKAQKNPDSRFWKTNLDIVEGLSLALFYACGNYYVAQQVSESNTENPVLAFAPVYWFLTFFLPVFYIYQGLKQKNRLILSVGFLAIAAGVATFRFYFHVMPMEVAAILAGAILLGIAYFSIQYLKRHKTPFTYEEDGKKPFYHQAESLIIAQSLGGENGQNNGDKTAFGGGDFGGGGAGQEF
jgi:uncharacterized membrane protein YgcG